MPSQKYLHINGVLTDYSDADAATINWSTSSPATCKFTIQLPSSATFPVNGHSVEWFRKDNTRIFNGNITDITTVEQWEGGSRVKLEIAASGRDDRLFRRTTWNRGLLASGGPGVCAQYKSYSGLVDTAGTAVTWVSNVVSGVETSNRFGAELAGRTIQINGVACPVASVTSPEALVLVSSAGTQTGVAYDYTLYCGDVLKDLLENGAYPSGALGGGYLEFEGFSWGSGTTTINQGVAISNKGLLFSPPVFIHDAIQLLLDANPDFYFAVDTSQVAYFGPRTLVAAPSNITPTSGTQKRNIQSKATSEDVRNVEISITNSTAIDPTPDTITGDGVTRSWFLSKTLREIVSVTLNGVEMTSADGSSTSSADFYYLADSNQFWMDIALPTLAGPTPGPADALVVSYKALFADLIEYEYPGAPAARAAIAGSGLGRFEKVIDRTNYAGKTDALVAATAEVTRLKDDYVMVTVNTFEVGFQIGQSFTLDIPQLQLSSVVLFIDEVAATDQGTKRTGYDFEYTLTCISISRRITELQILRDAFSSGSGSGSTGGSVSGGGGGGGGGSTIVSLVTDNTLTAPFTLSSPATPADGDLWTAFLTQNGAGGHAITFGTGVNAYGLQIGSVNADPLTMCVITFVGRAGAWWMVNTPILAVPI